MKPLHLLRHILLTIVALAFMVLFILVPVMIWSWIMNESPPGFLSWFLAFPLAIPSLLVGFIGLIIWAIKYRN